LSKRGIDAISPRHVNQLGETDESQLDFATNQGRTFVTFNVAHIVVLHGEWLRRGRHHAGVIVSTQKPIGEVLRSRTTRRQARLVATD